MTKRRTAFLVCACLLLGLAALPAQAKIYCWNCGCQNPCSQICYDGSHWTTCGQAGAACGGCGPEPFTATATAAGDEGLPLFSADLEATSECATAPADSAASDPVADGVAPVAAAPAPSAN